MSDKTDKKRRRQAAAAQELSRRYRHAEEECPLSRDQLDDLHDHLAEEIITNGHDNSFSITRQWLVDQKLPVDETLAFFESRRLSDDWELATNGDSYKLFGPTEDRLARMPLEYDELEALLEWLDVQDREHGCDSTTRFKRRWLEEHGRPIAKTEMALLAKCGGCDCEVVLNVEPQTIYPKSHE